MVCHAATAGANHWLRLSVAEGELSQSNLAIQRQLDTAADTWGQQMAELQGACEQRMAGEAAPGDPYMPLPMSDMPKMVDQCGGLN